MGKTSEKNTSKPMLCEVRRINIERKDALTPSFQATFLSFAIPYPAKSIPTPIRAKNVPLAMLKTPSM